MRRSEYCGNRPITRRAFLGEIAGAGVLTAPWLTWVSAPASAALPAAELERIEAALPAQAAIKPRKTRKLLIFDLNVGYGGHGSIPFANQAFSRMGQKTGAFETVISRDPEVFKPERLRQFDAVFLNNTVGNLFTETDLRQSLVEFVYGGGGLMGVHGTTVAFTDWTAGAKEDWPEFGIMLGARGANHRDPDEHVFIKLDDPGHPVNQVFAGRGFAYRDEFFRVHAPYSRDRVRVLFSIDMDRTKIQGRARGNCTRADNDYALAWVRQYGRGRVFYSTIAHNPYVFWDRTLLQFYLAATQFALGDLPGPTTPSARLTLSGRAQERLNWRLGLACPVPEAAAPGVTLFKAVDRAAQLGMFYLQTSSLQQISPELDRPFNAQLNGRELETIRLRLDAAGVRLLTYCVQPPTGHAPDWHQVFAFARKMGIEVLIGAVPNGDLDLVERLCDKYDLRFVLQPAQVKGGTPTAQIQATLKRCKDRSTRIGAAINLGAWQRAGLDPIGSIRLLGKRLFILQVYDEEALKQKKAADAQHMDSVLRAMHDLGVKPTMFSLAYPSGEAQDLGRVSQGVACMNRISIELAKGIQ